jgi:ornithine carbamoyltransferase
MTTKRDFLKLADLSLPEAREVFALSTRLKGEPKGQRVQLLAGRSVAIVLEKASTRTRVSFEVGSRATATRSCTAPSAARGWSRWPPRACP